MDIHIYIYIDLDIDIEIDIDTDIHAYRYIEKMHFILRTGAGCIIYSTCIMCFVTRSGAVSVAPHRRSSKALGLSEHCSKSDCSRRQKFRRSAQPLLNAEREMPVHRMKHIMTRKVQMVFQ